jgi:RimJ/RimL family protein N-acetyltransferase
MIATLETARLVLRDVTMADPEKYRRHFADYAVISELTRLVPWPYPADGVPEYFDKVQPEQGQDRWVWALYLKSDLTDPIGNIDLRRRKRSAGDEEFSPQLHESRGFWLARKHWGKGLMTEATDAVTDYAFDVLGFETMILSNALGNTRSRRIKEKAGAVLLRTEPATFVNPDYTHREVWELTKHAWKTRTITPPRQ